MKKNIEKKSKRSMLVNSLLQLILIFFIIFLINFLSNFLFTRIDLTFDKRYTLSDETKSFVSNLEDVVYVEVLLDGELPPGYNRLKKVTQEFLNNLIAYGENVRYTFKHPFLNVETDQEKRKIHEQLRQKGVRFEYVKAVDEEERWKQEIVYPSAIIRYRDKETVVNLISIEDEHNKVPGEMDKITLNNISQRMEYRFVNALRILTTKHQKSIAIIEGHKELPPISMADITNELAQYYNIERVKIDENLNSLTLRDSSSDGSYNVFNKYDMLIIARPDSAFSDKDNFIIDQFIMRGGKVMWFLDAITSHEDSLAKMPVTMAMAKDLNLSNLLFAYGARINPNIILDKQCSFIPIPISGSDPPRFEPRKWFYYPVISSTNNHPIAKDVDFIKTEFPSVIELREDLPEIKKHFLLHTSQYSNVIITPARVSVEFLYKEPQTSFFRDKEQPVAVLLEGKFNSYFKNKIPPEIQNSKEIAFIEKSRETSMLIVSDGDLIKNYYHVNSGQPYPIPIGADRSYSVIYKGNKEFVLNAANYLMGEKGFISLRTKKFKPRFLDTGSLQTQRLYWQIFNTAVPIAFVILFGFLFFFFRKRKYS
ncbi:MAG: gliding motility-associated ABC transporter substrate-binding protein GldG [Bacteroidales bacterium]|nr:gliding motility-associated ABC transporter substrate-binding protein GldG [Bacteroidales bacterium]